MSSMNPRRYAVAGMVAVVLAVGGYMIGTSNSGGDTAAASNAAQAAPNGQMPQGQGQRQGQSQGRPGMGTPATGTAARKAKAAALGRYPGTVEQVDKLSDGSYVVHVVTSKGEYHVHVSKAFAVTGADQGGPGGGRMPQGGAPGGATS